MTALYSAIGSPEDIAGVIEAEIAVNFTKAHIAKVYADCVFHCSKDFDLMEKISTWSAAKAVVQTTCSK